MTEKKKTLLIIGIALLAILLAALLALLVFGGRGEKAPAGDMTYTVLVKNSTDVPLEGVGVYIYEDETQTELVWFDKTNAEGKMSFTAPYSDTYVAVLGNVPTGYAVKESYPITGELTEIVLGAGVMSDEDMKNLTFKLGDIMMDFTVTDTDGVEHTLSELLKTKKAVVLNFWYLECVPCQMEFPFMQEAYEKYKDDLEILAMNPVNADEAAIAAFKKELGLSFPMAKVDALWEQMMALTAYPTTVVIDRFGNIVLIHKGSIDSADTFEQLFEYFTAEDYESKAIENLDDIVTKTEGSEENPSIPTDSEFEVTLEPGETYYLNLYKITENVYLTVKGEDFILTYKGKEYTPKNGSLTITINSEGPSTPVELKIQNTSDKKQTYYFSKSFPKGSSANPYRLSLGEFDISTSAGNEKGTFGTYTAEKSGTLTVRCLRNSVSKYGFYLYNLRSYAMRNADEDGKTDEEGYLYVSVQVKKGDQIQFSVAVSRDDSNSIPSGSFRFELSLVEGDGEEEKKDTLPTQSYTINVTDEAGKPVSGVAVNIKGDFTYIPPVEETQPEATEPTEPEDPSKNEVKVDKSIITDEKGTATVDLVPGPYIVTVSVPTGYKLEKTEYELTETITKLDIQMTALRYLDYTVKVQDPAGKAVSDVVVLMSSGASSVYGNTDAKGIYKVNQVEGTYTVSLYGGVPEEYASPAESFTVTEAAPNLTIKLIYKPGSVRNPIEVDGEFPIMTGMLAAGQTEYYKISGGNGMTIRVLDENAVVYVDGQEYRAVDGMVSAPIPEDTAQPVAVSILNGATAPKSYRMNIGYPLGTQKNPVVLDKAYTYITTRGLGGGDEVWYSLADVAGQALIISDPDAVIEYNGNTYSAVGGVVTVELAADADPALVAFRNSGSQMEKYSVRVGYPWGHQKNPVTVNQMVDITTRALEAGEEVWYSLSGVGGMVITVNDADAAVVYDGKTYAADGGVVNVPLAESEAPALVAFANGGAEEESYRVTLAPPLGSSKNPIAIKGVFKTLTTPAVAADGEVYYELCDVGGFAVSISGADYAKFGDVTYPAENGAVSFTIPAGSDPVSGMLIIGNAGSEDESYTVNVTNPAAAGTRQNPECFSLDVSAEGETTNKTIKKEEEYYYGCTVSSSGTLTLSLTNYGSRHGTAGVNYELTLLRNGEAVKASENDGLTASIQVLAGDMVKIHVQNLGGKAAMPFNLKYVLSNENPPTDDSESFGGTYVEAEDPNGQETVTEFVEPPEVIEEEDGENQFLTYTVKVTDFSGTPMANVIVQLWSGDKAVDGGMTNSAGVFYSLQRPGDYAVKLSFSDSGCYYEESIALLSSSVTSLNIPVTTVLPAEGGTHWGTFQYQKVDLGGTYLSMQSNVVNYYGFYPTQQGTYRIQVSDPSAKISYWGTGYPNDLTGNTLDYVGNAFTLSIGESMLDGTHFIGVTGVEDGILVITRLGDAQFDVNELPWINYEPAVAPAAVTGLPSGKTPTKVDVTKATDAYKLVYNDTDKYYHLGSANGPVMYVQLAADKNENTPPYIHINAMVGGVDANMATAFRWADYDDKGNYIKEDYTATMIQMCDYAEANDYGVYPLTKDLMYMIQQCGKYMGWWDPTSENHKVAFGEATGFNLEILWMFACCYFQ